MTGRKLATALILVALAGLTVVGGTGCRRAPISDVEQSSGNARKSADELSLGGAERLVVDVEMGAGTLELDGAARPDYALDASYRYTDAAWTPVVDYEVVDGEGRLELAQPDLRTPRLVGSILNEWKVALPADVPMELRVGMGAGESRLDLRGTQVRSVTLALGAGESSVDLSGEWDHDVDADITAGVGELRLRVPADVGVRIWGRNEGIGDYRVDDEFRRDGDYYVNDAWANADVRMDIRIQRGVGEISVESVR